MASYEVFSTFYDGLLEGLYREARHEAARALELRPGQRILDLPCGTGASFEALLAGVGPGGAVVGMDLSPGMLGRAAARVERLGASNVTLQRQDVHALEATTLPGGPVDRVLTFLGMSVFPRPDEAFGRLWNVLRPGGRFVVVDVHAEKLGLQGALVNFTAGAEVRRRSWEPLQARAVDFSRRELSSRWEHGGTLYLATGVKPA